MSSNPPVMDAQYWVKHLGLTPHPEGGFCKELSRGNYVVQNQLGKKRFAYSTIYFMVTAESASHLHRLPSDEVWLWHAGDAVDVHVIYKHDDDDHLLTRVDGDGQRTDSETVQENTSFVPPFLAKQRAAAVSSATEERMYTTYKAVRVGPNAGKGEQLQYTVPAGAIFGSSLAPGGSAGYTLLTCIVSPSFDFRDFELFTQDQLRAICPQHEKIIRGLSFETLPSAEKPP